MITISPGHFGKGTGAVGLLDEATEARRVAVEVARLLTVRGVLVHVVEDTTSKNQQQNIRYLVAAHNKTTRVLDVSIHFNAAGGVRSEGIGTEVLYFSEGTRALAESMSVAIAKAAGFKNRGAKRRGDLGFLKGTTKKALLIELCFVNSAEDVKRYTQHFARICAAIVQALVGESPLDLSSEALTSRIFAIWHDKKAIIHQLEQGVQAGVFQDVWLQRAKAGTLSIEDYLALCTLQLQKYF